MYDYSPVRKILLQASTNGVTNSPDIFKQKMNDLFHGFEFICLCIDDILILTKVDWSNHVQKLELTLNKIKEKDLNLILKRLSSDKPECNI